MPSLLLVGNPAKRRRKTAKRRTARKASPAQLRARAKFAAMSRARAAKRRSPARRKARRAASTSLSLRSNPVAKRRTRRHHVAKRRSYRVRRNPIGGAALRGITGQLKNAAMGAAGALATDVAFSFVNNYLPASLSTPTDAAGGINYGYFAAKGASSIALGLLLGKVLGAAKAATLTNGALTVTIADGLRLFAQKNVTSLPLGAYVSGSPRYAGVAISGSPGGKVMPMLPATRSLRGVGAYVSGLNDIAVRESTLR